MNRGKDLAKNTAIVAIGKVCTKFLSFFLLPLYTAVLTQEDYGIVELFNAYTSLLIPIIVFQIEDALFRFTIDVRSAENEKRKVISTAICFCVFQSILFLVVYFLVKSVISIPYAWYFLFNVIVSIFSGALLQLTRGLGDNVSYAFGSFLTAAVAILLNIFLVLFLNMGAKGLFITSFVSNFVGILYILFKKGIISLVRIRWFDGNLLKNMLAYSLPLIPNTLSWWILGASDKSIVSWFLGVSQNGILSVSQKFSTAYTTFYSIFNLTWTEHATVHKDDEDSNQYYSRIVEASFRVLASACLGIIAVVAIVFPWLVNINFMESYYQIPIYMLSSLLYASIGIYSVVYIAYKKTGQIAKTSFMSAVINVAINIALIQKIGLYAASISSVVAYGIMLVFRYFDIQKFAKIRMKKSVVLSVAGFMIVDFVVYYIRNTWMSVVNLICVAVYCVYLNREILVQVISMTKSRLKRWEK